GGGGGGGLAAADERQDVVFRDAARDSRAVDLRDVDVVLFRDLPHQRRRPLADHFLGRRGGRAGLKARPYGGLLWGTVLRPCRRRGRRHNVIVAIVVVRRRRLPFLRHRRRRRAISLRRRLRWFRSLTPGPRPSPT